MRDYHGTVRTIYEILNILLYQELYKPRTSLTGILPHVLEQIDTVNMLDYVRLISLNIYIQKQFNIHKFSIQY